MKITVLKSPNFSNRIIEPIGIVLHHTGGSYEGAVSWCLNPNSKVSYHEIVSLNGDVTILVDDNKRAWHSGRSVFKGRSDCNSFMLGIAVSGDTTKRELNEKEINAVAVRCVEKIKKYKMPLDLSTITTHEEIAPGRKNDVDARAKKAILDKIKELLK